MAIHVVSHENAPDVGTTLVDDLEASAVVAFVLSATDDVVLPNIRPEVVVLCGASAIVFPFVSAVFCEDALDVDYSSTYNH